MIFENAEELAVLSLFLNKAVDTVSSKLDSNLNNVKGILLIS